MNKYFQKIYKTPLSIDKVFIINLEHRTDRKTHMLNELKNQKIINYEFFKAIRPTEQELKEWNPKYCSNIPPKNRIGALGCLLSHYYIIKEALSRDYKRILILEDDTQFIKDFKYVFNYSKYLDDFHLFYLSCNNITEPIEINKDINRVTRGYTTGSYIITRKCMEFLIENIERYDKQIDVFYADLVQPNKQCYCLKNNITGQLSGYSDIEHANTNYSSIFMDSNT